MRFFVTVSLLVACMGPANAYIDAGSGSYMLQMAIAGIMALVFSIKLSWQKIKSFASNVTSGRHRTDSGGHA